MKDFVKKKCKGILTISQVYDNILSGWLAITNLYNASNKSMEDTVHTVARHLLYGCVRT